MITLENVTFRYPYEKFALFEELSLQLDGVCTVVCDKFGGKTTLCKLIMGLLMPEAGKIFLDGADCQSITDEQKGILYLSESTTVFGNRSVLVNVAYPLKVRKVPKAERLAEAQRLLEQFNLSDKAHLPARKLNSEELTWLALARGLTHHNKIVLAEGVGFEYTEKLRENAPTVVFFTSDIDKAVGEVIVIDGGKKIYQGEKSRAKQLVSQLRWI